MAGQGVLAAAQQATPSHNKASPKHLRHSVAKHQHFINHPSAILSGMIHSSSLSAFSGTIAAPSRPTPVRPVRDLVPQSAQAAPTLRLQSGAQPGVVPPGNTPRGSLLNLQV